jgi:hypothetical protein
MPAPPARRPVRTWLILETVLAIPSVAIGGFMAMMSVMMFDAPGTERNPAVILLFSSMVAFPLACLAAVILGWIAIGMRRDRLALWLSLLPVLPIVTGVIGIVWLQVAYDGSFVP